MSDSHAAGKKWDLEGFWVETRPRMGGLGVQASRGRAAYGRASSRDDGAVQLVTKTLRNGG